jgi:uncharacterized protein YkwD
MTSRGLLGMLAAALLCWGCTVPSGPARFPQETIAVPGDSDVYSAAARPEGVVGGSKAVRLQADLTAALDERGDRAEADGALSATASWALREVHAGRPIDLVSSDYASRHFGFGGVVFLSMVFATDDAATWRKGLASLPSNIPLTRYGIRISPSGDSAAVVLGSMEGSFEPIQRAFDPGQQVSLKGEVGPRFESCHVFLTKPDGKVEEKHLKSRAFNASFTLTDAGKYKLEVMGDGETGPVIVANLPLYVGIPEPAATAVSGAVVEPEQAEPRLLDLLNRARAAAGVAPLRVDAELRTLAQAHTEDMVSHEFVSHVSPNTGSPQDRARRAGLLISAFGENVATAATPEVVHEGLMSSPGHRANMLRAEFTHVGIAAGKNKIGLVVTIAFGRRPNLNAIPATLAEVETAVRQLRSGKGLSAVAIDPVYRAGAQAAADALATDQGDAYVTLALQTALQREVNRLHTTRPSACTFSLELLELRQLEDIPALALPSVQRLGIGARLHRTAKGTSLATVFMFEGEACK